MAPLTAIDRYLFKLIIVPLLGTLVVAAMLLLLEKMLNLFDFVVNEGGPVSVVWRMLGNLIPEYLSLGIPIGVTLGILLAFRRLALSSELDALNSVGMGYGRMLRVPFILAAVFALINFGIVGFLQPYSRYAYEGLRFELRSGALGVRELRRIAKVTGLDQARVSFVVELLAFLRLIDAGFPDPPPANDTGEQAFAPTTAADAENHRSAAPAHCSCRHLP
mgnify:CR=1 FL=1